jgi:cytochrome c
VKHASAALAVALALAGLIGSASADPSAPSGQEVFERRCRTCHGGTEATLSSIGPNLAGIIGRKAGTQDSGVHSRAVIDSGIVWDRDSLRRFLAEPSGAVPGTLMGVGVTNPAELESLLDYLESLR